MTEALIDVSAFDILSNAAATVLVAPACASPAWRTAVVDGRPYETLAAVLARSEQVLSGLDWAEIEAALAAHPRIGDRAAGADREAAFSRAEQSAAAPTDELRAANLDYEDRFGRVFLISASGRNAGEILAALRERLGNDDATEQQVVRRELAAIVDLRLEKTLR